MIPTLASKLTSEPLVSVRHPSLKPLRAEDLCAIPEILFGIRWSVYGEYVYCNSNASGINNIWRIPVQGGEPEHIIKSTERADLEEISPDGKFLVYGQDQRRGELRKAKSFLSYIGR